MLFKKLGARLLDISYGSSILSPSGTKLVFENLKAAFISEFQNSFPSGPPLVHYGL